MAPYIPLYLRRSDGRMTAQAHGVSEQNAPEESQLNTSPRADGFCDYYRLCKGDDLKCLDWRRKLAGMLVEQLGSKELKGKTTD